ncbi:A disintegrin and metalloproteinase with thrombospondin motifs 20-like [Myxocyprinus asiaticus]|uniref:A disintegrin and metalloproteinase with thrombospondin motifs 20-like n=1 Tax=Myxocyprinus asiaticus TaxID=70543 RepID=UPI0022215796|nr:A disintegrin and metalloproteinase with thrombospondin motifs 20-like [Myxocyprinus asiaticus]
MRFPALRLLALVWHLSALLRTAHTFKLHPKQESFISQLSSYDIITPVRLNEFGESFPHRLHYRRRRRSTDADLLGLRAHYRIEAFGQSFHLNLTEDSGFIAPSYMVLHLGEEENGRDTEDLRHCFFRGHVDSHAEHHAVFSLCTGLIGTFSTHSGQFFLEPLLSTDGEEYDEEHNKPHLVYRHDTNRKLPDMQPCTVSEHHSDNHISLHSNRTLEEEVTSIRETMHKHVSHSKDDSSDSHSRKKRFLSYPRFVELMVTADTKMVRHHGQNLEHYILTIMSVVAAIYRDPSVGNLVNIMIVKLIVIHNKQEGPNIDFYAASMLHNFCVWQQSHNILDDSHPSHHDTALLITREDICRVKDKCDTLGLAELGTMCDPYRSCSISEENGLSSSFTIAHELGHVFNMPHDDSPKCREAGIKHQYHVMAPTLNYNTSPWSWSKCSRKYITEFLDTGYGECLLDEPSGRAFNLPNQLPGQLYNANRQCELMFGPGSQVCPFMKQCKRLWCTSAEGEHKGCRTQHMPLADGTECGYGMHCRHGMCVNKEMDVKPVNGEWGPWGPYSVCSRTCGGGTRSTTRDCNKPEPRNGGRFCVGRRMKFRSCNTEACPRGQRDFREEQCAQFDGKHFNINGLPPSVRWMPKYSGILMKDRCKLFCRVAGTMAYYQLRDRVTDGTPCGPDTYDICVQGLCRQAGCDHVLNSKARNDKCGVCGGDNSSCKTLTGTFNNAQYGYNVVVRIPAGATNIDIKQVSYSGSPGDDNYLALSDSHSNFLLNGNFVVSMFKREVTFKGTEIEYSGSNTTVERINCTERIEEELVLQVLCVGNLHNPDVRYSFSIPIEEKREQFVWEPLGPWQECSRACRGERRRKTVCVRKSDHLVVSEQRCEYLPRPQGATEPCNTDCELRWHVTGRSDCSSKCGPGYRTLDVLCMRYSQNKRLSERVEGRACADLPKPQTREGCHGDCLLKSWQYSAWSQCSKSCGDGVRTRQAYCMNNLGRMLVDKECVEQQRVLTEPCNDLPCPNWTTSEWSECLVTCGKGVRHRQVLCVLRDEKVNDQRCDPNTKPSATSRCELPECAAWQVGVWSPCTVTCGQGYQMRAVRCVSGAYGETVDDRDCNAAARPRDSQDCEFSVCPRAASVFNTPKPAEPGQMHIQWRYGSWTTCSVSCGEGRRKRYVSCRDAQGGVADESYCAHLPRPPDSSVCFSSCGQWRESEWTPCSVSCGVGRSTRRVICMNYHHQVDESFCHPDERPSTEQECAAAPCQSSYQRPNNQPHFNYDPGKHPGHHSWNVPSADNQWRTGPWGACSSTCEGGFQRRVVVCQDTYGRSTNHCDERVKPNESKSCNSGPCPNWNYGIWGECTQSCGGGQRTRLVVCQHPNEQSLNEHSCDMLNKPPDMEQCNAQPCPGTATWHRHSWKPCSVSCGKGLKERQIMCVDQNQTQIEEERCAHLNRPRTHKVCRMGSCPSWRTNRWRACSVTCGTGAQTRETFCRSKGKGRVNDEMCDIRDRPASIQSCFQTECQTHSWTTHEWTDCNATCGRGVRTRAVFCVDGGMNTVSDHMCDTSNKPTTYESCHSTPCQYVWVTTVWSQCSVSCGFGLQHRAVYCSAVPSYSQALPFECSEPAPPNTRPCQLTECLLHALWKVSPWSKCSQSCGAGVMERRVECLSDENVPSNTCPMSTRPESRATCRQTDCELHTSCRELQMKEGIRKDGEHYIKVRSKILQIYCAEMQSSYPKEYVTLRSGQTDNYSEVYGYRLQNPFECPYNGSRRQDCMCRNDYAAAGYTVFHRVRLDLSSMCIITTDGKFSQTLFGRSVPFATAGDCYSAAKCPQGQFSINLTGTGLKVADSSKWVSQGNYVTVKVHRSEDGTRIYGRCGGFCGKCLPHPHTGLLVHIQ